MKTIHHKNTFVTVYGKFGHNAACVNVGKSIEFF